MTDLNKLVFFKSQPHPCSYLENHESTTLFLSPDQAVDTPLYARLSELGFRRSGEYLYRPHCEQCNKCIPTRIAVSEFSPNRQQRKIINRNSDLTITPHRPRFTDEYFALYCEYIAARHHDGDMYPPSREQFISFLAQDNEFCTFFEFRKDEQLLAVAVCDLLPNGLSAIYTFYDVEEERRSLGTFAILWQIQETLRLKLPALYLGYWVKECRKMSYKTQYRPIELLAGYSWQRLS